MLPSEKEMKQDLMNNAIYNEYNVEELESTFTYVRQNSIIFKKVPNERKITFSATYQ